MRLRKADGQMSPPQRHQLNCARLTTHSSTSPPPSTAHSSHPPTMAFVIRRPFAISATLRQTPKSATRAFHNAAPKQQSNFFTSRTAAPSVSKSQHVFRATFRRGYQQQSAPANPLARGDLRQRMLYGAGIFGGTLLAINLVFNRETREDGGMPTYEREYLNDTFMHTGLGVGIIGLAARQLHVSGWSYRLMAANPWLVMGLGLVGSIGTMYGCMATDPRK